MTSEAIKDQIANTIKCGTLGTGTNGKPDVGPDCSRDVALWEIAYQLAVANERAEGPKKSQFWKCPNCSATLSAAPPIERPRHTCGAWMEPL